VKDHFAGPGKPMSDIDRIVDDAEVSLDGEPLCLVCGGEGIVDDYDDLIECTSCHGSGLAKDMTWC